MLKQRNYGIDLLRVVLMLLIITGHMFVHTDIRNELSPYSSEWFFSWIYQTVIVCAVNCFVLITGYFSNADNYNVRIKRIVLLYGQVLFYSVAIYAILVLAGKTSFSYGGIVRAIFPVASGQYWFFSSYILLMFFIPFLNVMLSNLNDYCLKFLNVVILLVFYCLPVFSIVFMQFDPTEGMGIIGFVTLYVIGYSLNRLKFEISKKKCVFGILINCAVVFISKLLLTYLVDLYELEAGTGLLYHYNSIFQLINAILLLMLFKQINFRGVAAKFVGFLGSSVFGVYLIHEHPCLRNLIWNEYLFNKLLEANIYGYIGLTLLIPLLVFAICLAMDKIRRFASRFISKVAFFKKIDKKLLKLDDLVKAKFLENIEKSR